MDETRTRKELATRLGIGIETLRYYERIKLIPPPRRAANGYREYTAEDERFIDHILTAKRYGLTLREIRTLFSRRDDKNFSRAEVKAFMMEKVRDMERRIKGMRALKKELERLIETF